ncbi:MAG: hypothetical protein Q9160_003099 [Pyrenula sp. 1 TL-2023]
MGPYLESTAKRIESLESNLAVQKARNERLEGSCKRLWDIMKVHIAPMIDDLRRSSKESEPAPASPIPPLHPAALRTPVSIPPSSSSTTPSHWPFQHSQLPITPQLPITRRLPTSSAPPPSPSSEGLNHLLSLHEILRTDVSSMNSRIDGITSSLQHFMSSYTESESRANMMLLNDVLRMKEDLAHTNAAMFSMRAQLGWLSRINGVGAAGAGTAMGRQVGGPGGQNVPMGAREEAEGPSSSNAAGAGGPSTSDGRPLAAGFGRRSSDGHSSQERVKL